MQNRKVKTDYFSLKKVLLSAFIFMMIGTLLELYLLDHYESLLQFIPILCIGLALVMMLILFFLQTKLTKILFKLILGITALSGAYGAFLHLSANYEFEQEMTPTLNGWNLFTESLSGALPALAPFSMVVLALIGYSYLIFINQKQ